MKHSLKHVFDCAIEIELTAAQFYQQLERVFRHIPDAEILWREMAADEVKHAEILQETRDSLAPSVLSACPGDLMRETLYIIAKQIKAHRIDEIKNLHDAIEIAHEMESSEINSIFKVLSLHYFPEPLRDAFIESEITGHQARLIHFSRKYRTKEERAAILPKGAGQTL